MSIALPGLLLVGSSLSASGQIPRDDSATSTRPQPTLYAHSEWPQANPADIRTIQSTVHAFYEVISVPAGHKIDRTRLRSLFVPEGRIAAGISAREKLPADVLFRTPDQYADDSDASTSRQGFFDSNPANEIERFGLMAHVYSTYESRASLLDKTPMARGIKSFELLRSGDRWWIVQVYWDTERPGNPLPERFLHDSER